MTTYSVLIADAWSQGIQNVCEEAISNIPYRNGVPADPSLPDAIVDIASQDIRHAALFVLTGDGVPVGILLAVTASNHPALAGVKLAQELAWYVQPEHRGSQSWMLVTAYEDWAKMLGITRTTMSHFNDAIGQTLATAFATRGYAPVEYSYIKELT